MSQAGNNEESIVVTKNSSTSPIVQTYSVDKLENPTKGESTITINLFAGSLPKADKPVQTETSLSTVLAVQEGPEVTPPTLNSNLEADNLYDEVASSNKKSWNSVSEIFESDKLMDLRRSLDLRSPGSTRTTSDLERRKLEAELKAAEEIAKIKQSVIEKRLALELAALQEGVDYQKVKPSHCESPCKKKLSSNFSNLFVKHSEFKAFEELAEKKQSLIDNQLAQDLLSLEYQPKSQQQQQKQQHLLQYHNQSKHQHQHQHQQQQQLQLQQQQQLQLQQQQQQSQQLPPPPPQPPPHQHQHQQQQQQQAQLQQQQQQQYQHQHQQQQPQQQQQPLLSRQMQNCQPNDVPSNHSRKAWQRLTGKGGPFNLSRRESMSSEETGCYLEPMKQGIYKNDSEMNSLNGYNNNNMMGQDHKHSSKKMNFLNSSFGRNSVYNMNGPEPKYMALPAPPPPTSVNYVKQMNGRNNYYQQQPGVMQPQMQYEQAEAYSEPESIWKALFAKIKRKFRPNRTQGNYQ